MQKESLIESKIAFFRPQTRCQSVAIQAGTRKRIFRKRIIAIRLRNYRYPQIGTTFGGYRNFTYNRLFRVLDAHG